MGDRMRRLCFVISMVCLALVGCGDYGVFDNTEETKDAASQGKGYNGNGISGKEIIDNIEDGVGRGIEDIRDRVDSIDTDKFGIGMSDDVPIRDYGNTGKGIIGWFKSLWN